RLDDRKLAKVAKWHQDWKAKQATQEAFRERTADDLLLTEAVGLYTVKSAIHSLTLHFDHVHVRGNGIITEVTMRRRSWPEIYSHCVNQLRGKSCFPVPVRSF